MPKAEAIRGGWFARSEDGQGPVRPGDVVEGSAEEVERWAAEGLVKGPEKPKRSPKKKK